MRTACGRGRGRAAAFGLMLIIAGPGAGAALAQQSASAAVTPNEAALIAATIADAADQGFPAGEFSGDPETAAISYARAEHGGRIPAPAFIEDWAIRPGAYDAAADFAAAVAGGRLAAWLRALPPADPRYAALARAYVRYRDIAAKGGWPVLTGARALKPGDGGPAVGALRARLAAEDQSTGQGDLYDPALEAAVKRAQARYGRTADGRAGPATIAALNVSAAARVDQIAANLERWRWAPRQLPPFRIELNTADATLELHDAAGPEMAMRAVVGRASKPTPMFADAVRAVVFNPPWNVPKAIAIREIWPKMRRDRGYMAREGFVATPGGGLRQTPGPRCALGVIKFDLANSFGVYLHDTPARTLFALDSRALSHGCMRLEHPVDLGKRLLATDPDWPETAINLALLSGKTVRVPLRAPTPVFVFYWTAFVDDRGQVQFRRDVYGWDAKLLALLARPDRGRVE